MKKALLTGSKTRLNNTVSSFFSGGRFEKMAELFWCEVKVEASREEFELVAEVFQNAGSGGVVYDDPEILKARNFEPDEIFSDQLLEGIVRVSGVKAYFPADDRLGERIETIKDRIATVLGKPPRIGLRRIQEDDWAQAWKAYFKPERIGRVVIKPSWEEYNPVIEDVVVELDPGMAFGTGNHPTTRLCLELLQELVTEGMTILDLGTGSGVLAVAGAKLGAAKVTAIDIDPVAVRVARENCVINRVEAQVTVSEADLLHGYDGESYDLVIANIVADIIVKLVPDVPGVLKPDGIFLTSGIITERSAEVEAVLKANGFKVVKVVTRDQWVAIIGRRQKA
jgi:ribosomal protein L11 methyltransferase